MKILNQLKMKSYNKILLGAALLSFMSCTKDFEEMNVSPNQPAEASAGQLFATAQYNFADNIGDEWNNGRMGMYYAQYWSSTYYTDESRYKIREGVNQTMWNTFYADVLRELQEAQKLAAESNQNGSENQVAIAEIFQIMTYHYLSDIYGGPIPYSEALDPDNATPKYDSGPEVYAGLLADLEKQIAILDVTKPGFTSGDIVYSGNVALWKKFANSLRMRIALRMIDADEAAATEAIRKSLDPANGGIISSNEESALFRWLSSPPNNNPINEAFKSRVDFSMSATFVNYLKKYNDPRLPVYAQPLSTDPNAYVGELYGLKQGDERNSNGDQTVVSLPSVYAIGAQAPTILLDYSEVEFMLAEIAARNLSVGITGTAEEHYQKGIKASFAFANLSEDEANNYIARVPYVAAEWKDAIGSQKWIAMYTQGIQAWLERLRLDFEDPYTGEEIFVAPIGGSTDPDVTLVPERMSYPVTEAALNGESYQAAIDLLGKNSKGVKTWWDIY
ncbi:SusD/RagB family nutrient-binding outer membrane lipoprotein [Pontibacter sp. 172403-2]|uniref:SusD/RagB family nutrient-binding outer membrane lipoprotein n=1 Tax=Pontibacter rufus TaxID=2791028 RepID=UPI0018AFA567|nr:SusD/RagB family nutrient-binding outer membrane lipoprotein [Pontibacter sp. 172403-2]MBF9255276.1 SusD/RagB family nutrient-binding outer membrane lipoprotein [Pontibacter sp. 172403-2]